MCNLRSRTLHTVCTGSNLCRPYETCADLRPSVSQGAGDNENLAWPHKTVGPLELPQCVADLGSGCLPLRLI